MYQQSFYMTHVYPQLNFPIVNKYPFVTLNDEDGYHALAHHTLYMLVALTGTGKTTTLNELARHAGEHIEQAMKVIPSRREIADWIAIPTAQHLSGENLRSVTDRVERFHYTRTFAEKVPGGMATAFSWVNVRDDYENFIISEGIRGANELTHALTQFPNWHIIELALDPISRLKRLSSRQEAFDKVRGGGDVSFLPEAIQTEVEQLLVDGDITEKALTITKAESESYGLYPFADGEQYANYHRVDVDDMTPQQVAQAVHTIMKGIDDAND